MEFIAIVLSIADGQHPDEKLLDNHPATASIGQWLVKCWAADAGIQGEPRKPREAKDEAWKSLFFLIWLPLASPGP